jgi:hypothetical protein
VVRLVHDCCWNLAGYERSMEYVAAEILVVDLVAHDERQVSDGVRGCFSGGNISRSGREAREEILSFITVGCVVIRRFCLRM